MSVADEVRDILARLEDDNWFEAASGQVFEWGYDIDNNIHRWFPLSFERDAPPAFQMERALRFPALELFGLSGETVYVWDHEADSYVIVKDQ